MATLVAILVLSVGFAFINGFHDAANSIATVVTTRVLTPTQGVLWSACFNFVAYFIAKYFIGEFGIADTVSKTVLAAYITLPIILAGISAAILWNLITWWFGIPSSSSHTLIGGFAGAAIAAHGFDAIHTAVILKILSFIFVAPLIGMLSGSIITLLVMHLARYVRPHKADVWFKKSQLVSSALLSVGHGLNDTQVMGIMAAALICISKVQPDLPAWLKMTHINEMHDWVPIACFTAIAAGTMTGGWRVMKTMGNKITKITPMEGFCAQTAGAATLLITETLKIPVSTTHVITGSIMGVGAVKRMSAVRWGVTLQLLIAWVLTVPISALVAICVYGGVSLFF